MADIKLIVEAIENGDMDLDELEEIREGADKAARKAQKRAFRNPSVDTLEFYAEAAGFAAAMAAAVNGFSGIEEL